MTNHEIFCSQWQRLKEEMIEKMDRTIKQGGTLSFSELNRLYTGKMVRWEGVARPEGRWMEEIKDTQKKKEFLEILQSVRLTKVSVQENKEIPPIAAGAVGAAMVLAILVCFKTSILICLLGVVIGFSIPTMFLSSRRKRRIENQQKQLKTQYVAQIEKSGEKLAAVWSES